jgi:putative photosynthetic complex assembly protein
MSALAVQHPRLIPSVAVVMLGGALLTATVARLTGYAAQGTPPELAQLPLNFADLADGGVAVRNATTGALLETIPARDDGFLRMTMRLLAGARARENITAPAPFVLTEFLGGRMQLADPQTGLKIELEAFGPSNIAEYAGLFAKGTQP